MALSNASSHIMSICWTSCMTLSFVGIQIFVTASLQGSSWKLFARLSSCILMTWPNHLRRWWLNDCCTVLCRLLFMTPLFVTMFFQKMETIHLSHPWRTTSKRLLFDCKRFVTALVNKHLFPTRFHTFTESWTCVITQTHCTFGDKSFCSFQSRTMEQFTSTSQRCWLTTQSVLAVTKDIFVWIVGPRRSVNYFNCAILLTILTYFIC